MSNQEESEETHNGEDQDFEESSAAFNPYCCGCFKGLVFWKRNADGSDRLLLPPKQEEKRECYLREKAKKVKEFSEILAGPRWKNFIRRFSVHGINGNSNKKRRSQKFQYDPQSYAMNFDDGVDRETDSAYPDFSARFTVAPVGSFKS
ncbi:uncharacterized protein LOC126669772 [Mercurialis annua]|uniref:uncharacterized protein LOC126669772 n=1 Tax=Mercurialis annua TaxID=3986 RepID=UPI00215E094D|nr:uncharacterized protein LOC126669772 [Mercurialis annua]